LHTTYFYAVASGVTVNKGVEEKIKKSIKEGVKNKNA
jgi:hypothetical protein